MILSQCFIVFYKGIECSTQVEINFSYLGFFFIFRLTSSKISFFIENQLYREFLHFNYWFEVGNSKFRLRILSLKLWKTLFSIENDTTSNLFNIKHFWIRRLWEKTNLTFSPITFDYLLSRPWDIDSYYLLIKSFRSMY